MAKPFRRGILQNQEVAKRIAGRFGTFECAECATEIARSLGKESGALFERLTTSDQSDVIGFVDRETQVSANRVHVGVRVGDKVFDNHHPGGVLAQLWAARFVAGTGAPLRHESKPVRDFFGRSFLTKIFLQWLFRL